MDPYKGGLLQELFTIALKIFLNLAYLILKLVLRNKKEQLIEPKHLVPPPDETIPSLKLAQALNPNTPPAKFVGLSKDESPFVRRAVCRNPALKTSILKILTSDKDVDVRNEALKALKDREDFDPDGYELPHL